MKILIINWRDTKHPKAGGAEIVTMEHARRWVRAGNDVTWLTSAYRSAPREEMLNGVRMVRRGGSLKIVLYAMFYVLVNGRKFDVIVDEIHGIPFFTPLLTRTPVVAFIHEIAGEIWDYMYPFPVNLVGRLSEKFYFLVYRNTAFWTDAPSTITELEKQGIPRENCMAIPCPVEIKPVAGVKKETRPVFLFVSRVVKMKGIEEVIKAFAFIRKELPDSLLWIVGGGDDAYVNSLKMMINEYGISGCVRIFGKVPDQKKHELMARSHLLLHASVKEGWGLVVLEAAVQGTPTVAYDVSGLKDVVRNRMTGIVISSNTPKELAQQAVSLFQDKKRYRDYQLAGRKWVNSLSWDDAFRQSLGLLQNVAENKKL